MSHNHRTVGDEDVLKDVSCFIYDHLYVIYTNPTNISLEKNIKFKKEVHPILTNTSRLIETKMKKEGLYIERVIVDFGGKKKNLRHLRPRELVRGELKNNIK